MSTFFVGLDLGQSNDYTALTIVQDAREAPPWSPAYHQEPLALHLRHLLRYALGTSYPEIVRSVTALMGREPLKGQAHLVADATGVGQPVVDMFTEAGVSVTPVYITGGNEVTIDGGSYKVPKRDLVSALQVAVQNETLKVAPGLDLWPTLRQEMQNFKVKINLKTGHDSYEHWRDGDHDDLVLSAALAVWYAKQPRLNYNFV